MPEALLPGQPICATASVVVAESIAVLLRTLHANQSWNSVINSAVIDRLQHVDSLANLLSHQCHDGVSMEADKLITGSDVADADSFDKTVTVRDDVIETVDKKYTVSGTFVSSAIYVMSFLFILMAMISL